MSSSFLPNPSSLGLLEPASPPSGEEPKAGPGETLREKCALLLGKRGWADSDGGDSAAGGWRGAWGELKEVGHVESESRD